MATYLEQGTCRISINGTIKATGFLISGNYVLTCTHVIQAALDNEQTTITVSFQKLGDKGEREATLLHAIPLDSQDYNRDIAVLELAELPQGAETLAFSFEETIARHNFNALGFPKGNTFGADTRGYITSNQLEGIIQLETDERAALYIEEGFSGGAVRDENLRACLKSIFLRIKQ